MSSHCIVSEGIARGTELCASRDEGLVKIASWPCSPMTGQVSQIARDSCFTWPFSVESLDSGKHWV